MSERIIYSKEFKDSIVQKILSRGNKTMKDISTEVGINYKTAARWVYECGISPDMKTSKKSKKITTEEKFKILLETSSLSEEELGVYLRKNGFYSNELDKWKQEFIAAANEANKPKKIKDDRDQKIKYLEREIQKKEKALAEASTLLILQKKASLIWGNKDED